MGERSLIKQSCLVEVPGLTGHSARETESGRRII